MTGSVPINKGAIVLPNIFTHKLHSQTNMFVTDQGMARRGKIRGKENEKEGEKERGKIGIKPQRKRDVKKERENGGKWDEERVKRERKTERDR